MVPIQQGQDSQPRRPEGSGPRPPASGKIVPSLWFDRNCEEAVNAYIDIFNGSPVKKVESKITMIKRYPSGITEGPLAGMDGKILTVIFELEGQRFLALDGGPLFKPTEALSLYIECESQEEIDHFWEKLGEGGDPNARQCGWLKDKYGFSWQVSPRILGELLNDPDKAKSDRVLQAMLQMKKLDIAALERAARGEVS